MKSLGAGILVGLLLGVAGSAVAAQLVGETDYLYGWAVVRDGEVVCHDPYVFVETQEIQCD